METKTCITCGHEKPVEDFYFDKSPSAKPGQRRNQCKTCVLEANSARYRKSLKYNQARYRRNSKENRDSRARWLIEYFKDHPCVDCGESDPVVLDFDHIDPKEKSFSVSTLLRGAAGAGSGKSVMERLAEEVAKCEVRCANCHRRRTAKQFGWRRAA